MHHLTLALLHTVRKSRQHSLCGAREGRNPFAARRPMPGQRLKAVIALLTSLRSADLAAVTCWKLDGTFWAAVSPPKVKALQAQMQMCPVALDLLPLLQRKKASEWADVRGLCAAFRPIRGLYYTGW